MKTLYCLYYKQIRYGRTFWLAFAFIAIIGTQGWTQNIGDYKSNGNGGWSALNMWLRYDGSYWVIPTSGQGAPTNTSGIITILNGDIITITGSVTANEIIVNSGGQIIVGYNRTLTVTKVNGTGNDLIINGTVTNNGTITALRDNSNDEHIIVNGLLTNNGTINTETVGGVTTKTTSYLDVAEGGKISCLPTSIICGTGGFSLSNGGTIEIGSVDGIVSGSITNGNIRNSGTRTLDIGANYIYNNPSNQNIGNGLPTTVNNLTLNGGGVKTVAASSTITINGTLITNDLLTINSDAGSSGSLIVNGTCTGNVTYNRWMDATRWFITSAPVNATNFGNLNSSKIHQDVSDGYKYDFAPYIELNNAGWEYQSILPSALTAGEGYLISLISQGTVQFTGRLNNGDVKPTVTNTGINNGWNAVGNPYTSAIKITGPGGFLETNINSGRILSPDYAAIYVWNEDETYTGNQQYYKAIGNSGYIIPSGTYNGNPVTGPHIQAGQGFLIRANTAGTVSFTKTMQVHDKGLGLKSANVSWHGITLLAESHGQRRSTVVAFNDQMTNGLDVTYDAGLLASDNFQLYTHLASGDNTVDFTIQCLPDSRLSVPVGVDLPEGGDLVFKASGIILPDGLFPVIEDKELGIKTALKTETDCYTVTLAKNTSGTGRFYLSIEGVATWNPEVVLQKKFTASLYSNRITINGTVDPGTKAQLFDITGRKVGEYALLNPNHNEIMISDSKQGVYLLKINGGNYSQMIKLVAVNTNF